MRNDWLTMNKAEEEIQQATEASYKLFLFLLFVCQGGGQRVHTSYYY